jgi:hypothetical protein
VSQHEELEACSRFLGHYCVYLIVRTELLRVSEFAERAGRSGSTVRRREREGRITPSRTVSGQRYFTQTDVVSCRCGVVGARRYGAVMTVAVVAPRLPVAGPLNVGKAVTLTTYMAWRADLTAPAGTELNLT